MLGFEHQAEQGRVLQGEADIGAGQLGQAAFEIGPSCSGGAAQGFVKSFEATQGQGIEQCLLVGEVTARRGVADAEFPAEFPQRDALDSAAFQGFLGRFQQSFAQISMMIGAGRRFHFQHLTWLANKLQYVSIDNIVSTVYIVQPSTRSCK